MRNYICSLVLLSSILWIGCTPIAAQSISALPKLTPSYADDFQNYKSYPSLCFDQAFIDKNGKLWLTTCGTANTSGLLLYQFDGYEFRLVEGGLSQFSDFITFAGLQKGRRLYGYLNAPDNQQLFFYDLEEDLTHLLDSKIEGDIIEMKVHPDGKVVVITEIKGAWLFYELKDGGMILSKRIPAEDQYKHNHGDYGTYFFSNAESPEYWRAAYEQQFIQPIHPINGAGKKYFLQSFLENNVNKTTIHNAYLTTHNGETYYYFWEGGHKLPIFKLDKTNDRFLPLKGIPANWYGRQVYVDQIGNFLFLFEDETGNAQAILEDTNGKRYNYSAFFKDTKARIIRNAFSPDFKKQLLFTKEQGLRMFLVKDESAIQQSLNDYSIRAMAELPDQQVLVTIQDRRQFLLNKTTNSITALEKDDNSDIGFINMDQEKNGDVLIGGGGGFYLYKYEEERIEHISAPGIGAVKAWVKIDENRIVFQRDRHYLDIYNRNSGKVESVKINGELLSIEVFIHNMLYSKDQLLWVATSKGLLKINLETEKMETIGLNAPFLDSRFMCINEDEKGRLWLGTPQGGLHIYDPKTGALKILNSDQGLGNNTVASITVDDQGDRWVGTYNGIALVNSEGDLITNLYKSDGLSNRECNRYASLKTKDGTLLIGTIKGLNIINPQRIKNQLKQAEDLKIYLTSIAHYDHSSNRDTFRRYGLNTLGTIDLPASQRDLDIRFAVSNYFKAKENTYAYMLEGLDKDWLPLGNRPRLSLSNMPAGKYRLLVKGSDGVGNWTPEPLAIAIHAREYFYRQFWFYPLCILIIIGLASLWIYRLRTLVHKATRQILEDKELIEEQAEQLKELDKAKSRFFTNISHEFRTPLTIISGMASQLIREPDLWAKKGGQMIKRNSNNLLQLINQILDLRKLESMAMDIQYIQGDVILYLQYITESFESYTKSKGLSLHFLAAVPSLHMDYDPDKLMKIVANLLSNAIKYTPAGKDIYFHLDQKEERGRNLLQIRVEDTGTGIPEEQMLHIFDRFFKVGNDETPTKPGTGIGLALTKELVELLKGSIEVSSKLGKGTTFIVKLPITNESSIVQGEGYANPEQEEALAALPKSTETVLEGQGTGPAETQPSAVEQDDLPRVLVVEDNKDVQEYIISCLQNNYQLDIANNGKEGVEKAIEIIPDIIISDVMMPEKNGLELTYELKKDERSSHIPIILLTSRIDTASRISGLEKGADIYLNKPFEPRELVLHLHNLLEVRKRLQQRYSLVPNNADQQPIAKPESELASNPFLEKIRELVETNISEADYGIPQLSRGLAMSRSQVFRKVKALTGNSPSVFIRNIRLHKGKELLSTTELSVSEVAYEVGFSSPNYFSRTFSAAYGFPPADLRQ